MGSRGGRFASLKTVLILNVFLKVGINHLFKKSIIIVSHAVQWHNDQVFGLVPLCDYVTLLNASNDVRRMLLIQRGKHASVPIFLFHSAIGHSAPS